MALFAGHRLTCIRGERTVFADLDFTLESGRALVLQGPNGSGKSSLLRVMAGLLRAEGGALTWDGAAVRDDPEAHGARLHYLGHGNALKQALSAAENVRFWAGLQGGGQDVDGWVMAALARFEIAHLADLPARFLSAGQSRRLALARLLAAPAPLWLLDEPANALDARATAILADVLSEHQAGGGMVALATHARDVPAGVTNLDLSAYAEEHAGEWAA
ncbi:MAG: heme ABC exporter ATP-binding protein CcmA [Rhodospirillales bacterium]